MKAQWASFGAHSLKVLAVFVLLNLIWEGATCAGWFLAAPGR